MWKKPGKSLLTMLLVAVLMLTAAGSAYAFNDVDQDQDKDSILRLKDRGVVNGDGKGHYQPKGTMTTATAVAMIVKGMGLNIDHIRFIKEPLASDSFSKVKDNAWYAQAFIVAHLNGLDLPRDIDPNAKVTREQFSHWLYQALSTKGDYPWIEIFIQVADADKITQGYMDSIQKLLIAKIATLDEKSNFNPKANITRGQAAGMLDRAIAFVEEANLPKSVLTDLKQTTVKLNDEVQRVTLSAQAPHPGYGIAIARITFDGTRAIIDYRTVMPDPDRMYPQMTAEVKANAYIPVGFEAVIGSDITLDGSASSGSTGYPVEDGAAAGGSTGFPIKP